MTLDRILDAIAHSPGALDVLERLPVRGAPLTLAGTPGSSAAALVAWLAAQDQARTFAIVAATPADAEHWLSDLHLLCGASVALYPQRESLGEDESHLEIAGERTETLAALLGGRVRLLVTTVRASLERTRVPDAIAQLRLDVGRGDTLPPGALAERLTEMGYERVATVTEVGQFSVRGGILDVYGFGMALPARLEWWGDEVASLRGFDLTSQRSGEEQERIVILPLKAAPAGASTATSGGGARRSLLDLLPPDTLVVLEADAPAVDEARRAWDEAAHHLDVARRLGDDVPRREEIFADPDQWHAQLEGFARLILRGTRPDIQLGWLPPERLDRDLGQLAALLRSDPPTLILCDNEGQRDRLEELLDERGVHASLMVGALDGGFVLPRLRVLTDHEIFRRARRVRRTRRYRAAAPSLATGVLAEGDYVVHLEHGIGIYRGIETITVGQSTLEVAILEYEGGSRLNVPLYRLDQLERYRAAGEDGDRPPPRIHRLGGTSWARVRERAQQAIRKMAAELLELYARRKVAAGFAFPPDTRWQRELEASFLYEDTRDQRRATDEIKRDMERPLPMDRLLVGDVGYGKTEVAVRAAFKAVQGGKQAAVLVPTTILAEQHGHTFAERLADYPITVEVLSRFRTAREQKDVLERLARGTVDVVIGTHRLLSKDVKFHDLGLLIVDEEHRFGVRHKERLKAFRLAVDVLTLTATPIPRTLHLSLAGLRDLSLIETAPRDRSPVLTFVEPWDDALLEEALAREVDRGGQVFFVHNRIETIDTIAERVRHLAPRARVDVAHGQMPGDALEDVMRRFVAGEVDILVTTMIVESGLDVPNANTMIVHDAHRFGLAQLYQLRGRVGRSHRRAYCYLLVPDMMDRDAEERLKVLEHHSDLGAGYRIALKDLEIRGAGNLLGAEQSGHAHAVGFDLYMRWLEETVRALRGRGEEAPAPPDVVLDAAAHLPDSYVADDDVKLDVYRRLARAESSGEIDGLGAELRERFGPLPEPAATLLHLSRLRRLGAVLGLQHVTLRGDEARLTFRDGAVPRLAALSAALDDVQLAADVRRTVPLSLRIQRLGGEALTPALVRALRVVAGHAEAPGSPV
jgi:transcription-repair coupling factor (superfamily II helicase)